MSGSDVAAVLLLALAGFLVGGAYSTWRTARPMATVLAVAAVLAAVAGGTWLF